MTMSLPDFTVETLGEPRYDSPLQGFQFIRDEGRILYHDDVASLTDSKDACDSPVSFERAGPRERIFFDPTRVRCAIVTCGGLSPGLNDVIRAIVLAGWHLYDIREIYGFQYGYEGLAGMHDAIRLTPEEVAGIRGQGGTMLKSSRGPQEVARMVDVLERRGIDVLFTVGGDGTLRGAAAIREEAKSRGMKLAVVGVPKTIDNDISYVQRSFGFNTAVAAARDAVAAAHVEAEGARNGIGLVKLMGRHSGYIAVYATLASGDVNFCLIPESPFSLDRLLRALEDRLRSRAHAVVVVAEGAGQDLFPPSDTTDASGNRKLGDVGILLRDRINRHFGSIGMEVNLKYIDPSYTIRSCPADALDASFCLRLGQNAVHAAMAGKTNMVIGFWHGHSTHVPIAAATSKRQVVDLSGWEWNGVLGTTGQPREF
jgi:6-phosphofructokinase 1